MVSVRVKKGKKPDLTGLSITTCDPRLWCCQSDKKQQRDKEVSGQCVKCVHVMLHRPSPFNNFFHPKILVISSCFQPVSYIICIHWVYKFYFVQSSNPYDCKSETRVKIFQYDDYSGYILV